MSYNKIRRIGHMARDQRGSRPDATAQDHNPLSACSSIWSHLARRAKRSAAVGGLAALVAAAAVTPAHAASLVPSPNAPHTPGMVKPAPVAPRLPVAPAAKPNIRRRTSTAGWAASLTASPFILWPTQYSTLTATANADVGPTPYYLGIYDSNTLTWVAECGTGTTCQAAVTMPTPTFHVFMAVVGPWHTLPYSPGALASAQQWVYWQGVTLTLTAGAGLTTLPPYTATILTATTSADIGPSPFFTSIYDTTTGTRVQVCGFGTTCSLMVIQTAAGTHRYIAYVGANSTALPPPSVQETSASVYVTWSPTPIAVSLFANPAGTTSITTVTAKTTIDVGPTPYYIEIFNENGTLLARCGSGTTCSFTYAPPSYPGADLVAFVSSASTSLPPANTQGSSNVVHVNS